MTDQNIYPNPISSFLKKTSIEKEALDLRKIPYEHSDLKSINKFLFRADRYPR